MFLKLKLYCLYLSLKTQFETIYDQALFSRLGSILFTANSNIKTAKIIYEGSYDKKSYDDKAHIIRSLFYSTFTNHTCAVLIDKLALEETSKPHLYLEYTKDDATYYKYINLFDELEITKKCADDTISDPHEELAYGEIIL